MTAPVTPFLDLRYAPVGGGLASQVNVVQASSLADYASLPLSTLQAGIRGRHVLIATHGFNVDRAAGIASLANWGGLLRLPAPAAYIGLLWPGDSVWAHGLDYPDEPKVADHAGALLAPFLDANFRDAASISLASHSLGARVALATIAKLQLPVRRLMLMAGAIGDDCLDKDFAAAAQKVGTISVLASKKDTVLSHLFPIGNFLAGIVDVGHPWWRAAIGHCGPARTWPANFQGPFEIPDDWNFNHGNYLQIDTPPAPALSLPVNVAPQGAPAPDAGAQGFQEAFTSAFVSTRFR
jgi:pimeloyl-ACP methyl ester carboxylesterase